MVKEGYWFGLPPLGVGGALLALRTPLSLTIGAALILLALFVFSFFRNPDRKIPMEPGVVVSPADGRVVVVKNEENVFTLSSEYGEIVFKQIAGWVARRVVSWKKTGDEVGRGELVGLVRFGSRVDLWLPEGAEIAVK